MMIGALLLIGSAVCVATHLLARRRFLFRVLLGSVLATTAIMAVRLSLAESPSLVPFVEPSIWFALLFPISVLTGAVIGLCRRNPHCQLRLRSVAKWTGSIACSLVAATWLYEFSLGNRDAVVSHLNSGGFWMIGLSRREINVIHVSIPNPQAKSRWLLEYDNSWERRRDLTYWRIKMRVPRTSGKWQEVMLPFWSVFLFAGLPTALFWYLDRPRLKPGHCEKCGYNLTGNISGTCPECGTPCASKAADA